MSQFLSANSQNAQPTDVKMFGKEVGSNNERSSNLSDSDSEAGSDSLAKKRAARVGLRGGRHRHYTLAEKFAARVTVGGPDDCWLIVGCGNRSGHAKIAYGSKADHSFRRIAAHHFAWEQANGRPVPVGMVVMHACDQPKCCNPRHLQIGTQADNIHDSIRKGRYNTYGRQRLNAAQVHAIRDLAASGVLQKDIARQFDIARNTVSGIVNRATWAHLDRIA